MAVHGSMADLLKRQEGAMGTHAAARPAPLEPPPAPPVPAAAPPPVARPSRRRGQSARAAVLNARDSSRHEPQAWVQFTIQMPSGLRRRLLRRLAQDQADSGDYQLGLLHYMNAAYSSIPHSPASEWVEPDDPAEPKWTPPAAARLALAWRHRTSAPQKLVKTGSQLQGDVARVMRELGTLSKLLPYRIWAWEILAEALARLLDELDAEQGESL